MTDTTQQNLSAPLVSLPLEHLIAAPLVAATNSQKQLGSSMIEFINMMAYGTPNAPKSGDTSILTLPMTLDRPVQTQDGRLENHKMTVAPPLLSLMPLPALLIDKVDVNFSVTINNVEATKDNTNSSTEIGNTTEAGVSAGFGPWSVNASTKFTFNSKMTASSEKTRSSDQTAKYDIKVSASQQPQTEGMAKLLDLLSSSIEPYKIEA